MHPTTPYPTKKGLSFLLKLGITLVILFILFMLACIGFYFSVYFGMFGNLPTQDELKAIRNPIASEVYSIDNKLLGKYYIQNRTNVQYDDISANIIQALVATEDERFFDHEGVDTRSMFRVLFKTIILGDESSGGGSTISQQLIKNLFPRQRHRFLTMPINKTKEAIIARRLEEQYSKKDIIALYLNTVSFGEQAYGIETATKRFFSTTPKDISIENAAVLVGMLKAPTYYSPRLHPDRATKRRDRVFDQMIKANYLSTSRANALKAKPLKLNYYRESYSDGLAPHFREVLRSQLKEILAEQSKKTGKSYNIYTDGLKIYTTIDATMQQYAEQSVSTHMTTLQKDFIDHWEGKNPWGDQKDIVERAVKNSPRYKSLKTRDASQRIIDKAFSSKTDMRVFTHLGEVDTVMTPMDSIVYYLKFLNTGFMAMDPYSGHVKAWVGAISHDHFKYDHVTSKRQVGSTFKPIVYAAAMEHGISPCTYYPNSKITYPQFQNWSPRNSDGDYGGSYSMGGALTNSVNTVSVQVVLEVGVRRAIEIARKMGVVSDIPKSPTIALGTPDISLKEMLTAYSTFVNGGYRVDPKMLLKIQDRNNRTVFESKDSYYKYSSPQVLKTEVTDAMINMLQGVVDNGTGRRLRYRYKFDQQIGGKTGTTQSQSDGWFIGVTPKLVAGTWVGGQDRRVRFQSIRLGQGANMALPVYAEFMKRVYSDNKFEDISKAEFKKPSPTIEEDLDCSPKIPYRVARRPIWVDPELLPKKPKEVPKPEITQAVETPITTPITTTPAATTSEPKKKPAFGISDAYTKPKGGGTSKPTTPKASGSTSPTTSTPKPNKPKPIPTTPKPKPTAPAPKPPPAPAPPKAEPKPAPKPAPSIPKLPPKAEPSPAPKPAPPPVVAPSPPPPPPPTARPPKPKPVVPGPDVTIPSRVKGKPKKETDSGNSTTTTTEVNEKKKKKGFRLFKKRKKGG